MRREPVASSPQYLDVAFLLYIFPFARLALNRIPSELLTGRRLVYPGGYAKPNDAVRCSDWGIYWISCNNK
jgi:hypothetical protein